MARIHKLSFTCLALIGIGLFMFSSACKKKDEGKLLVYPNPATTHIIFDATGSSNADGEITIKNSNGDIVHTFRTRDSMRIHWQIDSLERGIYNYWYKADGMKTKTGKIQFN